MQKILPTTEEFLLTKVKPVATIGLVGGSDLTKIAEQMGGEDGKPDNYQFILQNKVNL